MFIFIPVLLRLVKQLRLLKYVLFLLFVSEIAYADYPSAPEFQLPTDIGTLSLSELQGKLVYIDFWASWCRPCKKSFPWMIAMKKKFKHLPFEIVAINLDKDKKLADAFIASLQINFPVVFDPNATVANLYEIEGMPSSYLIDPNGHLRIRYTGFWNKSKNDKEKLISHLLQQITDQKNNLSLRSD